MSIKAWVAPSPLDPPRAPFLWGSELGCIYLRNVDGSDIIICPVRQDEKLGRVVIQPSVDLDGAWMRRLGPNQVVSLSNA